MKAQQGVAVLLCICVYAIVRVGVLLGSTCFEVIPLILREILHLQLHLGDATGMLQHVPYIRVY